MAGSVMDHSLVEVANISRGEFENELEKEPG
jgi:hypothetical protein